MAVWLYHQERAGELFLPGHALVPCRALPPGSPGQPWPPACVCLLSCSGDALEWAASGQQGWLSGSSGSGSAGDSFQPAGGR